MIACTAYCPHNFCQDCNSTSHVVFASFTHHKLDIFMCLLYTKCHVASPNGLLSECDVLGIENSSANWSKIAYEPATARLFSFIDGIIKVSVFSVD